ncbi:uncharacterized protein LOC110737814 [Chenopodium quinoa]|uniref:DUF7792 domain-containing protein n=1 Tax=Chenopodium quinoa TaxID=63459 RepID=A0A803LGG5_CHEQI|nr:uncharacterized protein LOC110737814 [Chenopodium quinoa]
MGEIVKQILTRPVQLADQITKGADEAIQFRPECLELQGKTKKLADLIRQAARAANDLYERPTRRIIDDTEQVLEKALALVDKCRTRSLLKRVFTIIPNAAFRKMIAQLDNSIGDVSWLLRVSAPKNDDDDDIGYLGLPPIAANEPILCLIWEQLANLSTGSLDDRSDAAASLVSLARDNERYGKLIIEEGGVGPLLKLAKEGKPEGQENAARCIGLLGRDQESVEQIVNAGVCSVFAKMLKDGQMKVQALVAWAVSELAAHYPKCQDHFAQNNVIRLLVSHLAFETIEEHSKYAIAKRKKMSIHSVVMDSKEGSETSPRNGSCGGLKTDHEDEKQMTNQMKPVGKMQGETQMANVVNDTMVRRTSKGDAGSGSGCNKNAKNQNQNHVQHLLAGGSIKGREFEDPEIKAEMKAMAARALWHLAKGNVSICRSITESRALLCFAVLLEKGQEEVKYNSAMALMEITSVAEENTDLRRTAFKPTSPAAKAVVDQLLKVVTEASSELLVPCIRSIGNLARTYRATETRIIDPLVKLIDERETEIMLEAVIALLKFACSENYLRVVHCKSIIEGSGVKHLIQLVYFGEQVVQIPALILLCYIALHVPDSEVLAQEEVLIVLEWATKQGHIMQDLQVDDLLPEAKSRLELYQSRGSRF